MHRYFPHNQDDIIEMLKTIGINNIDELFSSLPSKVVLKDDLPLPLSKSEYELIKYFEELSNKNDELTIFQGAGVYDHFTPSVIPSLISRQEFLTAYTPYQPEVSQGTLHYIFEFQSMICALTGLEVANASMYDGATATAEAMFVACNHTRKNKIAISEALNPKTIEVIKTYAAYKGIEVVIIKIDNYKLSLDNLINQYPIDCAGLIVQNPNFYGVIEDMDELFNYVHQQNGLAIANVNPLSLALLSSPGEYKADIAVGEAQSLGLNMNYGGPYLGFMGAKEALVRKLPGRIVGMSEDKDGRKGFVLTFQAREQHIRREKANSNICSNQSLMALWATIYLSLLGNNGLKEVANQCMQNAHYLYDELLKTKKFKKIHDHFFFHEFIIESLIDLNKIDEAMKNNKILGGLRIDNNKLLFAVTEKRSKEEIDLLVSILGGL